LASVTAIAAGGGRSLAVGAGGVVYAWGVNYYGALGDGTTTDRWTPTLVIGPEGVPLVGVTAVASSKFYHSLAVGAGGIVYAWGVNWYGQLGDGTYNDRMTATVVVDGNGVPLIGATGVAAGYQHSLAIGPAGTVHGWGDNYQGQLGDHTRGGDRNFAALAFGCQPTPPPVTAR
jgi:alpha-tubulin suppressor-like RCC1 family protein